MIMCDLKVIDAEIEEPALNLEHGEFTSDSEVLEKNKEVIY